MERRNNKRLISFMLQQEEGGFIPVYMFDHAEEKSIPGLMLDISTGGCQILLSKTCTRLPETIHLKMLAPDQSVEVEAVIEARDGTKGGSPGLEFRAGAGTAERDQANR